jgi:hypothetical protein
MNISRLTIHRSRFIAIASLLALLSIGSYLLICALTYRIGFPLDDAWIHQTYARSLAQRGEWAFVPGQPSAGSTAPLWSALLAIGQAMKLGPYLWTFALGWALLLSLAVIGARAVAAFSPQAASWAPWVGFLLIFEWHLVWTAASGMETLLFSCVALLVLTWVAAGWRNWIGLGLLVGLSTWVRPDGITLLGPACLAVWLQETSMKQRARGLFLLGLGFTLIFGPYLIFNRLLAGAWWPNTFYAKQAEYAVYRQTPLLARFEAQARQLLQGVGIVLLPGVLLFIWDGLRRRAWGSLAGILWIAGYLALYAWRLPVAYQHGRYLIPVMPAILCYGAAGMSGWVRLSSPELWRRVFGRTWVIAAGLVLLVYWGLGAWAYRGDVAFIESEMVAAANWVNIHTEPGALVASHDIGALGYFGNRRLLDLAGLVSPQVIPFIRDEQKLKDFLNEQDASYLVTFPGWYPELTQQRAPLFRSQSDFSRAMGGENLAVYRWK